jgi:hypothetical protein
MVHHLLTFALHLKMSGQTNPTSMIVPTAREAQAALNRVKVLFARTLSGWACDVLTLRKQGLNCAIWQSPGSRTPFNLAA